MDNQKMIHECLECHEDYVDNNPLSERCLRCRLVCIVCGRECEGVNDDDLCPKCEESQNCSKGGVTFTEKPFRSIAVVGVTFDDHQYVISQLRAGDRLVLVREPENNYDPNAIAVMTVGGSKVGYLDRGTAEELAQCLDSLQKDQIPAEVSDITGGLTSDSNLGIRIRFTAAVLVGGA